MLHNKALGPVWEGCLKKPLEWCVCVGRVVGGAHLTWQLPIGIELERVLPLYWSQNWAWSGSLFKLEVANWGKAGLIQLAEVFNLASTMIWKAKMDVLYLVWAFHFAAVPTPPYCLPHHHLLHSLSFRPGPCAYLSW